MKFSDIIKYGDQVEINDRIACFKYLICWEQGPHGHPSTIFANVRDKQRSTDCEVKCDVGTEDGRGNLHAAKYDHPSENCKAYATIKVPDYDCSSWETRKRKDGSGS